MALIEPFEEHTNEYERWFEENELIYRSEIEAVRKLLPEGGVGLEIGVGSGRFAEPLGIRIGVEPSKKMGEIARKRGIEVVEGVAEKLPFADSRFDFALMVTTVCFVDDIETAFSEAYRVLKTSSSLIIGFIDRESPVGRSYLEHKDESVFYDNASFYSVEEVVASLRRIGFEDLSYSQTIFKELSEMRELEPVKDGFGEGSFVVIRAYK